MDIFKTTKESVVKVANKFAYERSSDLELWLRDIGKAGQSVYRFLATSNAWLTEARLKQLVEIPDLKVGPGLTALCYHGLAIQDGTWTKYHFSGELFKEWFLKKIFVQRIEPTAPLSSQPNKRKSQPAIELEGNQLKRTSRTMVTKLGAYKAVIENLSEILIKTDWRTLKGDSKELATVEFQLRDTILNLERLDADPEKYRYEIDLDAILEALNNALEELIWAANLADEAKVNVRAMTSRRIIECRKQLHLALGLMQVSSD